MISEKRQKELAFLQSLLEQDSSAEKAVEQKYTNEFYKISEGEEEPGRIFHSRFLEKFGQNISSISIENIELIEGDEECGWLMQCLIQYCGSLKRLKLAYLEVDLAQLLSNLSNLTHFSFINLDINGDDWTQVQLPHLKHLEVEGDIRLKSDRLAKFIKNNLQIESLDIKTHFNPLDFINGKLKMLKKLKLKGRDSFTSDRVVGDSIKLDSLESLNINCTEVIPVLEMFWNGCSNIKELLVSLTLNIFEDVSIDENALAAIICSFTQLTTLSIENVKFTESQIEQLGRNLQKLSTLSLEMKIADDIPSKILHVLPFFTSLTVFRIKLDVEMIDGLNYDFHQRFLEAASKSLDGLKLVLIFENSDELVFSKDEILHKKGESMPVLIHWIGYEAAKSISRVNILDMKESILNHFFSQMDLMSLIILKQTCKKLRSEVIRYAGDAFQIRSFTFNAGANVHELRKVFEIFGQYFHKLKIVVPGLCETTEIFGIVNRFCKNLIELSILSQCYTNGLINPVQFELPKLQKLTYKNCTDIELEISAFAGCSSLKHLELVSSGPLDDELDILRQNNSFTNLTGMKLHLTLGAAIKLLKSLNANVANQLEELWIITPVYLLEDEEELANVIERFPHLIKLHLIVPNNYMNSEALFTHCVNVSELSILYEAQDDSTKTTLQSIERYCKNLRILNIYRYEQALPIEVLGMASSLFPTAGIKSFQIDCYGSEIIEDSLSLSRS